MELSGLWGPAAERLLWGEAKKTEEAGMLSGSSNITSRRQARNLSFSMKSLDFIMLYNDST